MQNFSISATRHRLQQAHTKIAGDSTTSERAAQATNTGCLAVGAPTKHAWCAAGFYVQGSVAEAHGGVGRRQQE